MLDTASATWRPSPDQALLVRAATAEGGRALAAWAAWRDRVDMTKLDHVAQRMLPLLYRNLQHAGVDAAQLAPYTPVYKHTWAVNQVAIRHLEEILAAFAQRGIKTLVLKGAALLLRYYKDIGVRPMADFDVLVPVAQTEAAVAVLVERGWRGYRPLHLLSEEHRAPFHGIGYQHADKPLGCDLHWHIMQMNLDARYDAPMWEAADALQVGGAQSYALCAEHQLIHMLFNGCINEGGTNMRWLPDALVVLKHEPAFDWDRLVQQCQLLEFVQPVAMMLDYLRREWEVPVPLATLDTLQRTPVRYVIRKVYEGLNTRRAKRSGLQTFWILYTQYQLSQGEAKRSFPFDFIRFLRNRWFLDGGVRQTLHYAWQRTRGVTAEKAREVV